MIDGINTPTQQSGNSHHGGRGLARTGHENRREPRRGRPSLSARLHLLARSDRIREDSLVEEPERALPRDILWDLLERMQCVGADGIRHETQASVSDRLEEHPSPGQPWGRSTDPGDHGSRHGRPCIHHADRLMDYSGHN